ncbi:hypothetical protein JL722_4845 [Aureococcus anophagefferens]|nr:hypothetical protein JL722_4845 [Aureococcus anophagefferens]
MEGSSATRAADFEYERVARFVVHAACKRLALQFPDALLSLSPAVAMELEAFLPDPKPEVYVLGDPAPGGAVDCVAAAHVDADAIDEADAAADVLILAAPEYAAVAVAVADLVAADLGVAVVASALPRHARVGPGEDAPPDAGPALNVAGLVAPSTRRPTSGGGRAAGRRRRCSAALAALRCAGCVGGALAVVDPLRPDRTFGADGARRTAARALAKRHHAVSARDALGRLRCGRGRLRDVSEVAASCDAALRAAGRSSYVLAVGPVTPTKLANFAELEAFVIVGADHGLLDALAAESNAPLISPNELAVVLGDADWLPEDAPFYSCDLGDVAAENARPPPPTTTTRRPSTSPRATRATPSRTAACASPTTTTTTRRPPSSRGSPRRRTSQRRLARLEVASETPVRPAVEGRTGVASGYAQEERDEGGS